MTPYDTAIAKINKFKETHPGVTFHFKRAGLTPAETNAVWAMTKRHDTGITTKGVVYADIFAFLASGDKTKWQATQKESVSGAGSTKKALRTVTQEWATYLTKQVNALDDGSMYTILDIAIGDCGLWLFTMLLLMAAAPAVFARIRIVGLDIAKDMIVVNPKTRYTPLAKLMGNRFKFFSCDSSDSASLTQYIRLFKPDICVSRTQLQHLERRKYQSILSVLSAHKVLFAVTDFAKHESDMDIVDGGCILRKPEMMFAECDIDATHVRDLQDCPERNRPMWMAIYQLD